MQRIATELRNYVSERLGRRATVEYDGERVKVVLREVEASFTINLKQAVQVVERRRHELRKRIEYIKSRIRRVEERIKEVLMDMNSPEVVRYVRCKLYGGKPGFSIVARRTSSGVAVYKVVSQGGRKVWRKMEGVNADEWDLLEGLVEDLKELRRELRSSFEALREVCSPLGAVMDLADVMKRAVITIFEEVEAPPPQEEEDVFYEELLELELLLLRRRRIGG